MDEEKTKPIIEPLPEEPAEETIIDDGEVL